MALADDLNAIAIASQRALAILRLAQKSFVFAHDDTLLDDDTKVTLTPSQKQALIDKLGPLITVIKNRAGQLP